MTAILEHRLLEQQQKNSLIPPVDTIDLIDGPALDAYFDVEGSDSPTSLLINPTPDDPKIPKPLDFPATFFLSDLLRSDL